MNAPSNLLYAQSGGVTAVINASAAAVIDAARRSGRFGRILAARNGILGVLTERLVDTAALDEAALAGLAETPGGAFGSCRFDLDAPADNPAQYDRVFEVFAAHGIGCFLYNGGNGSMDTVAKLSQAARDRGYPLVCVGVPKTVDNDLVGTDTSPGYGSAAKYVATAMRECGLDLAAMQVPGKRPRVFLMEVMGRNAGWLAAATGLAARHPDEAPHLLLLPEWPLDEARLMADVEAVVARLGYCALTVGEGVRNAAGQLLMEQAHDAHGHVQLGGAGLWLGQRITAALGYAHHVAMPDYMQRAGGHLRSAVDFEQACAVGRAAVGYALDGLDASMAAIRRDSDAPYRWSVMAVPVAAVANLERRVPAGFLCEKGRTLSEAGRRALAPLIEGERPVPWQGGLPAYRLPALVECAPRLGRWAGEA